MARVAGIKLAVLTGRDSPVVAARCRELKFHAIKLGRYDKLVALAEIAREVGCTPDRMLYMGDDYLDLPVLRAVGVPVAVPEAPAEIRRECAHVTVATGGRGAVREAVDLVLKSRGLFGRALAALAAGRDAPGKLDDPGDAAGPGADGDGGPGGDRQGGGT